MTLASTLRTSIIATLFIFCVWLQTHIIISGDITWLLHVGEKLLAGGHYYRNFFEVNPPMCIYIYLIPLLLSQFFALNFITSIIIYIFFLALASLLICYFLLKKLVPASARYTRYMLECTLALTYFLTPAYAFGQREYLLVVLAMPYLLLAALRCQRATINAGYAFIIGVIAAIGFAQKPFFLVSWLLIELYFLFRTKNLLSWLRPESLACVLVFIAYGLSIAVFTPEYITQILPIIKTIYYLDYQLPFIILLMEKTALFGIAVLGFYCFIRQYCTNQYLADLLAISTVGMLFIYFAQHTLWYYHVLPVAMTSTLLFVLLSIDFFQKNNLFKLTHLNWRFSKILILSAGLTILLLFGACDLINRINSGFLLTQAIFNNPIYSIAKTAPGQPIYIFTENIAVNYPLIDYTHTISISHFPCLWLLIAASKLAEHDKTPAAEQLVQKIRHFVRSSETQAMIQKKPVFIFVQLQEDYWIIHKKLPFQTDQSTLEKRPAQNYLKFFLQDKNFAQFWLHYRYQETAGDFAVYRFVR